MNFQPIRCLWIISFRYLLFFLSHCAHAKITHMLRFLLWLHYCSFFFSGGRTWRGGSKKANSPAC